MSMNRLTRWILIVSLSVNLALLLMVATSFFTSRNYFYHRPHRPHELFLAPFLRHKIFPEAQLDKKHSRADKREFFRELYRNHPHLLALFFEIRALRAEFMEHLGKSSFDRKAAEATLQRLQQQLQKGYGEFYPLLLDWVEGLSPKQRRSYLRQFLPKQERESLEEEKEAEEERR